MVWLAATLCLAGTVRGEDEGPPENQQRAALAQVTDSSLRSHIRFLASDLLEGRGPGSRGDELAQQYIATQFESMGLLAAAPQGGWFQSVPLVGVLSQAPKTLTFGREGQQLELKYLDDFIVTSGRPVPRVEVQDAEVVFVGYGIVAPEYDWDDFKGMDLRGKILLMMNNDPASDPQRFGGSTRLYYGRWDYKYASAARQGAAGAIIIHTDESAGYPYRVVQTSWTGEEFELRDQPGPRTEFKGWMTDDAARRLVQFSGLDLETLRQSAEKREFRPVPLNARVSLAIHSEVRERDTANVVGLLPGSDPQLSRQALVYMAHHDHIGMAAERNEQGDNIYNGAVDNASGVSVLLSIARAHASLPERPRRSILFVSVGAEEQGLLGSEYFAAHPAVPSRDMAAVINIDGINTLGPTRDINVIGKGKSDLDAHVERFARWQRRLVVPDRFPDRGYYYRSDQFSLAKIGVPGIYLHSGIEVIGKPEGWGREQREAWVQTHYHQPSDEYNPDWDLRGAIQDAQLLFYTGCAIADQPEMPRWTSGDEFEKIRRP
jgi:Zn-dependent M28 family amino/carboxypeptidase